MKTPGAAPPLRPLALLALALCGAACPGTSADKPPGHGPTDSDDTPVAYTCYEDHDGDGYGAVSADPQTSELPDCEEGTSRFNTDCDDRDDQINPGAVERCDVEDDDCDGVIDEGFETGTVYADADGDGFGDPDDEARGCVTAEGYTLDATDCAPLDDDSFPGADEICDARDNDCDGEIDEDVDHVTVYRDSDGDGFGDPADTDTRCGPVAGWVDDATDCGPVDAHIYPEATEACDNGRDDDCDGLLDCEDDACLAESTCGEAGCADGEDDDDDGHTDCDDDECWGDPSCPGVIVSWVTSVGALSGRVRSSHSHETWTCSSETTQHTSRSESTSWEASEVLGSVRLYAPGHTEGRGCAWSLDHAKWRQAKRRTFELGVGSRQSTDSSWLREGLSIAGDCALDASGFLPAVPSLNVPGSGWYNATDWAGSVHHHDWASGSCHEIVASQWTTDWYGINVGDGENFVVTSAAYAPR